MINYVMLLVGEIFLLNIKTNLENRKLLDIIIKLDLKN